MARDLGTLSWGRRTGGVLAVGDRLEFARRGVRMQLLDAGVAVRRRTGRSAAMRVELPERAPDTAAARAAEALCRGALSPAMVNHSLRAWMWGALLGRRDGIAHDEEVLYVAGLLHDLHVADPAAVAARGVSCFAISGGIEAERFARDQGWDDARATALGEAIAMHANGWVAPSEGAEQHLLAAGTALDVVGTHRGRLHRDTVNAVLERHPRAEVKRELIDLCAMQAMSAPNARLGYATRRFMFRRLIAAAPFED